MIEQYFSSKFRPGNFVEKIVIATLLFLQNVNDSNNNSFLQHFSSNIHVGLGHGFRFNKIVEVIN